MGNADSSAGQLPLGFGIGGAQQLQKHHSSAGSEEAVNDDQSWPLRDLDDLFDPVTLLKASAKIITSTASENLLQKHRDVLVSFLEKRKQRNIATVTVAEFCKVLVKHSETREAATEVFNQMDRDGEGVVEVATMLEAVTSGLSSIRKDLGRVVKVLKESNLVPGFIDIYGSACFYSTSEKAAYDQALQLVIYLVRNRVQCSALPCASLMSTFNNMANTRLQCIDRNLNDLSATLLSTSSNAEDDKDEANESLSAEGDTEKPIPPPSAAPLSVTDTMVSWYMQMLASTTLACLPMVPHLRDMYLSHAKSAIANLAPMCLAPDKIVNICPATLQQLSTFLDTLSYEPSTGAVGAVVAAGSAAASSSSSREEVDRSLSADWVSVRIAYSLARGHLNSCLQILALLDHMPDLDIDNCRLVKSLRKASADIWKTHYRLLSSLSVTGCDGRLVTQSGEIIVNGDDPDAPTMIVDEATMQPYLSDEKKTCLNLFLSSKESVRISHINIKVDKLNRPKCALVFLIKNYTNGDNFMLETEVKRFAAYDCWSETDYENCQAARPEGYEVSCDNPVGYVTFTGDIASIKLDVQYPVHLYGIRAESIHRVVELSDVIRTTKSDSYPAIFGELAAAGAHHILVKLIRTDSTTTTRIGVTNIKFFGSQIKPELEKINELCMKSLQSFSCLTSSSQSVVGRRSTVAETLYFLRNAVESQPSPDKLYANAAVMPGEEQGDGKYHFQMEHQVVVDHAAGLASYDSSALSNYCDVATIIARQPFTAEHSFFEIEIINPGNHTRIGIGAAPANYPMLQQPGWHTGSIGWHADDGYIFKEGNHYSPDQGCRECTKGDKMGCGVEMSGATYKVYFTKNGQRIHEEESFSSTAEPLYPIVGLHSREEMVHLLTRNTWRSSSSKKKMSTDVKDSRWPHVLDMTEVTLDSFWAVHTNFSDRTGQVFLLLLFHSLLPYFTRHRRAKTANEIYSYLCQVVDADVTTRESDENNLLPLVAQRCLFDGATLFFANKKVMSRLLLQLLNESQVSAMNASKSVTLASLCHFFSSVDASGLLRLPQSPEQFPSSSAMTVLTTLTAVMSHECVKTIGSSSSERSSDDGRGQATELRHLVSSLQTVLFTWIRHRLTAPDLSADHRRILSDIVYDYVAMISSKVDLLFKSLADMEPSKLVMMSASDASILSSTFPQLVIMVTVLVDQMCSTVRIRLLAALKSVFKHLRHLSSKLPEQFHKSAGSAEDKEGSEKILHSWTCESSHNYQDNLDVKEKFQISGANSYTVEFDERCHTESRCDFLAFTGTDGIRSIYDDKVGTGRWPRTVTFNNCRVLSFHFHSDSSTNYWGYKFKVTARGAMFQRYDWMFDVYLSLSKLLGKLCGASLDVTQVLPKSMSSDRHEESEREMFNSQLWTTIFRGGFASKRLQRSFSGKHVTGDDDAGDVERFLLSLEEKDDDTAQTFLDKCRKQYRGPQLRSVGGTEMDNVVTVIFAALLWHTQPLRETLKKYVRGELDSGSRSFDGIHQAYAAAESLRMFLIEMRQKQRQQDADAANKMVVSSGSTASVESAAQSAQERQAAEGVMPAVVLPPVDVSKEIESGGEVSTPAPSAENSAKNIQATAEATPAPNAEAGSDGLDGNVLVTTGESVSKKTTNEADSVKQLMIEMREKALFLLKFAGLTKICKNPSAKQSVDASTLDKFPSFRLVLEFVRDPAWSMQRVEQLLSQRRIYAKNLAEVYLFLAEFIQCATDEHAAQLPVAVLLQELLSFQERFAYHYADGLDGCGLELEANVRRAYYALTRRLMESISCANRHKMTDGTRKSMDFIIGCILHLLDMKWKPFDLAFLEEVKLADFYYFISNDMDASEAVIPVVYCADVTPEEYRQHMTWLQNATQNPDNFNSSVTAGSDQVLKAFRARYCLRVNCSFRCDGCAGATPRERYRCLDCLDVDICFKCFDSHRIPDTAGHSGSHDLVKFDTLCSHCGGFIVGTIHHCEDCITKDINLCLGCFDAGHFPTECSATHAFNKRQTPKVKQTPTVGPPSIESYLHHHAWMLYSSLALYTVQLVHGRAALEAARISVIPGSGLDGDLGAVVAGGVGALDEDYMRGAHQLFSQFVNRLTDSIVARDSMIKKCTAVNSSKNSPSLTAEREMGLLSTFIPDDSKAPLCPELAEKLLSKDFITSLFKLARFEGRDSKPPAAVDKSSADSSTSPGQLAVGLVGKILQHAAAGSLVLDMSIRASVSTGDIVTLDHIPKDARDHSIAQFLFLFGSHCIERKDLDNICSVATVLRKLISGSGDVWTSRIGTAFTDAIGSLNQGSPDHLATFALFAIAGPQMMSVGTTVKFMDESKEESFGIVVKQLADFGDVIVMDVKSRKRKVANVKGVEVVGQGTCSRVIDSRHIPVLINFIQTHAGSLRAPVPSHAANDVLTLWALSFSLKALFEVAAPDQNNSSRPDLYLREFINSVVQLAGLPTGLSRQWLSRDLEVLSLKLFCGGSTKSDKTINAAASNKPSTMAEPPPSRLRLARNSMSSDDDNEDDEDDDDDDSDDDAPVAPVPAEGESSNTAGDPLRGIEDEDVRCALQMLHDDIGVSRSVLRAFYDVRGSSFLNDFEEGDDLLERLTHPNAEIQELAKKYENKETVVQFDPNEDIDVGMKVIHFDGDKTIRPADDCVPEKNAETPKLMSTADDVGVAAGYAASAKVRAQKSFDLLRLAARKAETDQLMKFNRALVILHARHLLSMLLSDWPEDCAADQVRVTKELLGCESESGLAFILDLLNQEEYRETFHKTTERVIRNCSKEGLVDLALISAAFMEDKVNLMSITKERHPSTVSNPSLGSGRRGKSEGYEMVEREDRLASDLLSTSSFPRASETSEIGDLGGCGDDDVMMETNINVDLPVENEKPSTDITATASMESAGAAGDMETETEPVVLDLIAYGLVDMGEDGDTGSGRKSKAPEKRKIPDHEDVVDIPGAKRLRITFNNSMTSTATKDGHLYPIVPDGFTSLVMSSSAAFDKDLHCFTTSDDVWEDFEIEGDRLYFKYTTLEDSGPAAMLTHRLPGYEFTVTEVAGVGGRFDTGSTILFNLLNASETLKIRLDSLDLIWNRLIVMASKKTGRERLKIIQLLMKLLSLQMKSRGDVEQLTLDMKMLRPLWLYFKELLSKSLSEPDQLTILVLALTELFYIVETICLEWCVAPDYAASSLDDEVKPPLLSSVSDD